MSAWSWAGRGVFAGALLFSAVVCWLVPGCGRAAGADDSLPRIGPAPQFALTAQDGRWLSLGQLRGKVVAVTFLYATCTDTCPILTAKMAGLQARLGADFGSRVFFVSITVDPERDTSAMLKRYAKMHGAKPDGWAFLTGTAVEIREITRRYGVYSNRMRRGDVEHTFLTSLVDQGGTLRVQYMGIRFNPDEMFGDLQRLLREGKPR